MENILTVQYNNNNIIIVISEIFDVLRYKVTFFDVLGYKVTFAKLYGKIQRIIYLDKKVNQIKTWDCRNTFAFNSSSKMSTKRNLNGQVSESYYSYIYVGRKLR